jgi:hypothetical protein
LRELRRRQRALDLAIAELGEDFDRHAVVTAASGEEDELLRAYGAERCARFPATRAGSSAGG